MGVRAVAGKEGGTFNALTITALTVGSATITSSAAPSTSPADVAQVWVADRNAQAGAARLATRTEDGVSSPLALQTETDFSLVSKLPQRGIYLTPATSGSNGIAVADNALLDMGTTDFSYSGSFVLPDYTPAANVVLAQKTDGTNGWSFQCLTTGLLRLTINTTNYDSSAVTLYTAGVTNEQPVALGFSVFRETATAAGFVVFYVNGIQIGPSVAITAGAPTTVSNAALFYAMGTSATRTEGISYAHVLFGRLLSAAQHLSLYRRGIDMSDQWQSSNAAVYTSNFTAGADSWATVAGTTVTGNIDTDADGAGLPPSDDWLKVSRNAGAGVGRADINRPATLTATKHNAVTATIFNPTGSGIGYFKVSAGGVAFGPVIAVAEGTSVTISRNVVFPPLAANVALYFMPTDSAGTLLSTLAEGTTWYIKDITTYLAGAVLALESEGIQPSPGQWLDSSNNKHHALQPAVGSSVTRMLKEFELRWTNTWAASHEAQYIGGVNQAVLPANCYIDSIVGVVTGSTVEDIIIGDGSDTDRWVALTSGLAAGTTSFTLANPVSDGANYKLVVDPDANFTGSIAFTVRGYILQ